MVRFQIPTALPVWIDHCILGLNRVLLCLQAAILQQTAEYIYTLEQEKTRLLQQNSQLKRLLALSQQRLDGDDTSPQLKKKRITTEGGRVKCCESW